MPPEKAQNPRLAVLLPLVFAAVLCVPATAAALDITVVDQHGAALQHAVVTATSEHAALAGNTAATVAQSMQQFLPRVSVVPLGAAVHFPNRDTTQHHVYSFSEAKQFELELYKGNSPDPVIFDRAGIVALGCNIHDWMLGYVYVTTDPLFGSSAADGTVALPASHGDMDTLTVWHPAATNAEPQTIPFSSLAGTGDVLQIVIETSADDPLEFELDPLQQLFSEPAE